MVEVQGALATSLETTFLVGIVVSRLASSHLNHRSLVEVRGAEALVLRCELASLEGTSLETTPIAGLGLWPMYRFDTFTR